MPFFHRLGPALAAGALVLSACSPDQPLSPEQRVPAFTINDGAHAGNPHFFFLPPMVSQPRYSGTFDASRAPVVHITQDGAPLVDLNAVIPAGAEHYQADWHTDQFNLDPAKTYRITIVVNGFTFGFADVDVVSSGKELKNVNTGEYIPLLDGRTLPIKFRIEVGAMPAGWRLVAARGVGPVEMTSSTFAPGLQAVFAARMFDYSNGTLWRFDLATDTWTQLRADNWPIGKYRKLVYDAAHHRLLTFWDGVGQVFSIPETGGAWAPEGSAGNSEDYYEGYTFLNPVTGRLSEFAGYGNGSWKNLLWEWDAGTNQWLNVTQGAVRPEPRFGNPYSPVPVDLAGKRVFLGERSLGAASGNYDDLWILDLTTNNWTSLIGPNTGPDARLYSGMAYAEPTATLYRFGGCGLTITTGCTSIYGELLSAKPDVAPVAWTTMPASGSIPAPRYDAGLYFDSARNRLVLVSGLDGVTWTDDVWAYYLP